MKTARVAAAVLDVLWSVASYERMVVDWQMDPAEATRGISWVIGLVRQAIVASPGGLTQDPEAAEGPVAPPGGDTDHHACSVERQGAGVPVML